MPPSLTQSYKQQPPQEDGWDAILIGSGLSNQTLGSLLARRGWKVLLLERHYTPGGFTHVFKRKRFEWDVGIHYIGEVHREGSGLRRMFDNLSRGQLEWADMGEVYDRIVIGGADGTEDRYDLPAGGKAFAGRLKEYFPNDAQAIDRYLELVVGVSRSARGFFMEKAMPAPARAIAGGWMRRGFARYARRSTKTVLEELTDNPRLRAVLAGQYGDYGLPPAQSSFGMHAVLVKHYLRGGAFPAGGSARLFETIAPNITENGGVICTNAEVARIVTEKGRAVGVEMADGRVIRGRHVVSGAGLGTTTERLLAHEPRVDALRAKARAIGPSASHLSLYIGLDRTAAELNLPKANYWIYPGEDHDASVAAYAADPEAPLPVAYISFPSAKDPTWDKRYPGRATVEVITLAPAGQFARWADTRWHHRGADYEAYKARLSERLLGELYRMEPQVRGHVETHELSTPLSTAHFTGYASGEIYGLAHSPARFAERALRPSTPLKNCWLTGQDIVSCGIGGALMAGVLTASAMEGRNAMADLLD
jgi:all-trans-retinol 13,14-reductase